jgi:hypothetical protein
MCHFAALIRLHRRRTDIHFWHFFGKLEINNLLHFWTYFRSAEWNVSSSFLITKITRQRKISASRPKFRLVENRLYIYVPLVFLFVGFLRLKTRLFWSNKAVSSMRASERTFSISLWDKSSMRVMPYSSRDNVKFCEKNNSDYTNPGLSVEKRNITEYDLRGSSTSLQLPLPKTENLKKSFCYDGAKLWNSLPADICVIQIHYQHL